MSLNDHPVDKQIGVGIIGMGWMGEAHANGYRQMEQKFYASGIKPNLVICSEVIEQKAQIAKERFGFQSYTTDWRDVVNHPQVDVVDITAPNGLHLEIIEACVKAGKHINCEKPIGALPSQTLQAAELVADKNICHFVGYNYRWAPMVQYAKQLINEGVIGDILHYRGRFFANYAADPLTYYSWRFEAENGHGALTDIMSHAVDMALFLVGDIVNVNGRMATLIKQRPVVSKEGNHFSKGQANDPKKEVTNDDFCSAMVSFANGTIGYLDSSRVFNGPTTQNCFEIHGSKGSLLWNFENMNQLKLMLTEDNALNQGYRTIYSKPGHPYHHHFNPADGNALGYEDLKTIESYLFLKSVTNPASEDSHDVVTFKDAAKVAQVLQAIVDSYSKQQIIDLNKSKEFLNDSQAEFS